MSFFHPVDEKNLRRKGVGIGEIPAGKCKGRKTRVLGRVSGSLETPAFQLA